MTDTPRTIATLQSLFADNTSGDISAQDLRDFLVTVVNLLDGVVIAPTDNTEVALTITPADGAAVEGPNTLIINTDHDTNPNGDNPLITVSDTGIEMLAPNSGVNIFISESEGNGSIAMSPGQGFVVRASDTTPAMFSGAWASGTDPDPLLGALVELQGKVSGVLGKVGDLKVTAGGYLVIARNSAPADASLAAGDLALWFDQTNGAAKLMLKGKSANGTVVTGNVALS
jgi:hypothetical protein